MSLVDFRLPPQGVVFRWVADKVWAVEHAFERANAEGRSQASSHFRVFFVLAAVACVFVALGGFAASAALFGGRANGSTLAPLIATQRADLVDREGRLLAADLIHYGLYVDTSDMWEGAIPDVKRRLAAALPDVPRERLNRVMAGDRRMFLVGGLTPAERRRLHDLGLPGVTFEEEARRVYPLGASAAHYVGFADSSGKGLAGAERALDAEILAAGREGRPVPLALDLRVQGALENELRQVAAAHQAIGAVGLITNVRTGEIIAMSSWPEYDPNTRGSADAMKNRAAAQVFEMGSTFKVFTVAMGLDSGAASMHSTYDATTPLRMGGRTIHDFHAKNTVMTLEDVFIHSSNIGTTRLALDIGRDRTVGYFEQLGLFRPAEVELIESARPLQPRRWGDNELASASFGHAISVTPLALAQAMGAVLNGGRLVPLTIRKVDRAPEGPQVLSPSTSRAMLDLMRINVVRGTGGKADAPGLRVGGKTGSAEKVVGGRYARDKLVSSFAAVFPTDNDLGGDRYLVLILVDEPRGNAETFGLRTGGWVAAPVAGRVIDRIAPFLGVERRADIYATATGEKRPVVEENATGGGQ